MPLRKLLLRVLLVSLALAAVFGAGGVLLAEFDAIWRIAWTAFWTAISAGIMLLASLAVDRPAARLAGLAALALVTAEYLVILGVMWEVPPDFAGVDWEDLLISLAWIIPLCGIPAVVCLRMTQSGVTRVAGWVGVVLASAAFGLLLAAAFGEAMSSSWYLWESDLFEIAGGLGMLGPLAVLSLVGAGRGDRLYWRWIGVACATAAFFAWTWGVIYDIREGGEPFVAMVAVACVVAHAAVLVHIPLAGAARWLTWATIASGALTGGAVATAALLIWGEVSDDDDPVVELLVRLASAGAVLAGCGTLAVLVLSRLTRKVSIPAQAVVNLTEATVLCPVCHRKQAIKLGAGSAGSARCGGCGLIVRVRFEEPHCPTCDYSLLMFTGDRCPECGTPVGSVPAAGEQTDDAGVLLS
jgi:hypothetical protein